MVLSASQCLRWAVSVSLHLSLYDWDELSQLVLVCVQLCFIGHLSLCWSVSMCLEWAVSVHSGLGPSVLGELSQSLLVCLNVSWMSCLSPFWFVSKCLRRTQSLLVYLMCLGWDGSVYYIVCLSVLSELSQTLLHAHGLFQCFLEELSQFV